MENLFVYGTLMFPEILYGLTGKKFELIPAKLNGYARFNVKGCNYPAIVMREGSMIEGLLLENIDEQSLNIISNYEGDQYKKEKVVIQINDKRITALTFLWNDDFDLLEEEDWDRISFANNKLKGYVKLVNKEI